jgi:hypothetical protein
MSQQQKKVHFLPFLHRHAAKRCRSNGSIEPSCSAFFLPTGALLRCVFRAGCKHQALSSTTGNSFLLRRRNFDTGRPQDPFRDARGRGLVRNRGSSDPDKGWKR